MENKDSLGKNCFHYAVTSSNTRLVEFLIEKRRDLVYSVDISNSTPLHYSISNIHENQTEIIRILIEKGADPNCQDEDGNTPLHYAAIGGM